MKNSVHRPEANGQKHATKGLFEEVTEAIRRVGGYGSVEIYVQDNQVTQITSRVIKKTRHTIAQN